MARHNREGSGVDQLGLEYEIGYQPDWLKRVKVTRLLETGRQSTMTLFRNPAGGPEARPGDRVRTSISSPDQGLDVEVAVTDPGARVRRIRVVCEVPGSDGRLEEVEFTMEREDTPT